MSEFFYFIFFCNQCYDWQMHHIFQQVTQAAVVQFKWQEGQADYQGKSEMLITWSGHV